MTPHVATDLGPRLPRVWAEIDLAALRVNLDVIRRRVGPGVHLLLVVKADAYGHGAVVVAREAERSGVSMLGVGDSRELAELRDAGIRLPILVLGVLVEGEEDDLVRQDGRAAIHDTRTFHLLEAAAARCGRRARVHLKIDTGLGRLGCPPERAGELLRLLARSNHLVLEGVFTHLADTDAIESEISLRQLASFRAVVADVARAGLEPTWLHAAGSAALFSRLPARFNLVRPGIAAYGLAPLAAGSFSPELQPVMALRSQIAHLKDVPAGARIGYNGRFVTRRPTRIATVPAGYNDGIPFRLTGKGRALVRGRCVPIVGAVSMDYVTLDVGSVPGVRVTDRVTLIGRDGDEAIEVPELARATGTIPYEIPCSLGARVDRIFRNASHFPREASVGA